MEKPPPHKVQKGYPQTLPGDQELVLHHSLHNFLLLDRNLRIVLFNQSTFRNVKALLGITLQKGMSVLELSTPERIPVVKGVYELVLQGESHISHLEIPSDTGSRYFEIHYAPAFDAVAGITGVVISARDITEWKNSEESYRQLFYGHSIPMWRYDLHSLRILEVNDAALAQYGYTREEFLRLRLPDLRPAEDLQALQTQLTNIHSGIKKTVGRFRHKKKNGDVIYVQVLGNDILHQGTPCRLVSAYDVTEQVLAEEKLRISNERFTLAAKAASEALWEWNVVTGEAYISEAYTEMFGWKINESRQFDEWHDYIHPDDREETIRSYYGSIADPSVDRWEKEYRYLKADGTFAYVFDKAVILRNNAGSAIRVIGALQNITVQKEAEEALRTSNERFALASRAASDAIYDWNIPTGELYWSEGLQTLFGHANRDSDIDEWQELVAPQHRERIMKSLEKTLQHPRKKFWKEDYLFAKADGSYSYVQERGFIVRDADGNPVRMIGSVRDITEIKLNEQLLSLERTIFELSSNPGQNINDTISRLLEEAEEIFPDALPCVLEVRPNNKAGHLASRNIPRPFLDALEGTAINLRATPCTAAIVDKKPVIVPDLLDGVQWASIGKLAADVGIRSCWSLPIVQSTGSVSGSFTLCFRESKSPSPGTLITLERVRNILRVVLENHWSLQQIKLTNERFDLVMRATHDLIWDWNLQTNVMYRDQRSLEKVYGVCDDNCMQSIQGWISRVHPDDQARVNKAIRAVIRNRNSDLFEVEYRFRRDDGSYSHVYDRAILLRDPEGKPVRFIGAAQDISERKKLEKELLHNELDHQKAINRATVETQEQERKEIGRELHDNVNQVLTTTKLYLELASSNPELRMDMIKRSTANIINIINEIRQLSRSLMDPSIGDLGLADAIHDLVENVNLTRKLQVTLQSTEMLEDLLDKDQKLTIYRIIQEALNNAVKHAKATKVNIRLSLEGENVKVVIEDDGVGFNMQKVRKGAGLKNIQNRVYLMNGTHTIASSPSKGSTITIQLPIR